MQVTLLSSNLPSIQGLAAGAIWNLAASTELRAAIAIAGAIPGLVTLLASSQEEVRGLAAGALRNLAAADDRPARADGGSSSDDGTAAAARVTPRGGRSGRPAHADVQSALASAHAVPELVKLLGSQVRTFLYTQIL